MSKQRPENLSEAAVTGDLPAFREFLREGCNVNKCDGYGRMALYYAAAHNRLFMMKALIKAGADPNVRANDGYGWTPLICACCSGYEKAARLLLKAGAEYRTSDKRGWTPLHYACRNGYPLTVRLLLDAGADPDSFDFNGSAPLNRVPRILVNLFVS